MSDNVDDTFSYGTMCKDVLGMIEMRRDGFSSVEFLVEAIVGVGERWPGDNLRVEVRADKALLRCEGGLTAGIDVVKRVGENGNRRRKWDTLNGQWWLTVKDVKLGCIIGVNPHERVQKQSVTIDITIPPSSRPDLHLYFTIQHEEASRGQGNAAWRRTVQRVFTVVEASSFQTLEALAALVARTCLEESRMFPRVQVRVEKPSALSLVEGAGVEIIRDRRWLEEQQQQRR